MNIIILILKSVLFLSSIHLITINFLIPFYYSAIKNYKEIELKNKNITANVNHKTKTVYLHPILTGNASITLIVLIYDFYNLINIKK